MSYVQKRFERLKVRDEKVFEEFFTFLKDKFNDSENVLKTRVRYWTNFEYEIYAKEFCELKYDLKWFLRLA